MGCERVPNDADRPSALSAEQIRYALADGLKSLHVETKRAVEALQRAKQAATAVIPSVQNAAIALFVAWSILPTPAAIAALSAERDQLESNIAVLNQRGARADLRRCGTGHLCVQVDLKAPRYGDSSDYLVIKGY